MWYTLGYLPKLCARSVYDNRMTTSFTHTLLLIVLWFMLVDGMVNLKSGMVTSSSQAHDPYFSPKAVDGLYGSNPLTHCFVSANSQISTAWWMGDIGHVSRIINIDIQFREGTGRQKGYFLYVSNSSSWTNGKLCYHDNNPDVVPDVIQNKTCELDGRYVMVVIHSDSYAFVEICEIDVYGCRSKFYGEKCEFPCYCKQGCNVTSGICDTPECLPGWKGMRCDTKCGPHLFGANCSQVCQCRESGCHHITGYCDKPTCLPGYRGDSCNRECAPGTFGGKCSNECHCETSGCSHVTGICKTPGCSRGWHGITCSEACGPGTFGEDCNQTCHCLVTGCNPFIGSCYEPGCEQGWSGDSCDIKSETCGPGTFGEDCNQTCHCLVTGCNPFIGSCYEPGCEQGWSGDSCDVKSEINETSSDECEFGKFGKTCSQHCYCDVGDCDHVTGTCLKPGCMPGWRGAACDQTCGPGTFGEDCNQTCHCLVTGCNPFNGSCYEPGCEQGWSGDSCDIKSEINETSSDECEFGKFGKTCSQHCYCDVGDCDHVTGTCLKPGCMPGWRGAACDQICDTGTFGENCNNMCHCLYPGCDHVNGTCYRKEVLCQGGWTGESCDGACPAGSFGTRCSKKCHCRFPGCHHVTGTCDKIAAGCLDGWKGDACDKAEDAVHACPNSQDLLTAIHDSVHVCPNNQDLDTAILLCVLFGILLSMTGNAITMMLIVRRKCCQKRQDLYTLDGGIVNKTYDDLNLPNNEETACSST
ncbi:multiple epidermal growth factor-like domains protein 10 isoform X2 [Mizuhopecten yessoensis]|uniref:multiple epidermal growth factor-like domains protein 10 isoform X2 n=1 Tax=Mizuhopecten yessoensis TaxID=6573 RepID=UPI000B45E939|nr:multiple epidermal growth factor-like domains protein 10 isoform X2 [Mizuhopecten yessoensis]